MKTQTVICPGIHPVKLTTDFVDGMQSIMGRQSHLVLPTQQYQPYCAIAILQWLQRHHPSPQNAPALSFIAFSAGVVGGIGVANWWQLQGGKVASFVAFDGWGMPLIGNFPVYRVSHDRFTHHTSGFSSGNQLNFYADPEVEHLELWSSPHTCNGWQVCGSGLKTRCSLPTYLQNILAISND